MSCSFEHTISLHPLISITFFVPDEEVSLVVDRKVYELLTLSTFDACVFSLFEI